jgi:hypothetical protein
VVAGVAVLALAAGGFFLLGGGGDDTAGGDNCIRNTLRVAVGPDMKDLADQAIKVIDPDEPCLDFEVYEATAKQVVAGESRR